MGSVATPNVSRPYAEELALCQRYYFEEFSPIQHSYACFLATELTSLQGSIKFPVTMRITPTFTITSLRSNKDGSQGTFATWSTQINKHGINAIFNFTFSPSYTIIQGTMYTINFKADAEIY
jgi:hypothetical protein